MGWAKSGPEFHVNSGSCRVGSLHLWVGLGRVKKIGPTSNFALTNFFLFFVSFLFWSCLQYTSLITCQFLSRVSDTDIAILFVRPSVCLSVRLQSSGVVSNRSNMIILSSAYDSTAILVFILLNFFAKFRRGHHLRGRFIQVRYENVIVMFFLQISPFKSNQIPIFVSVACIARLHSVGNDTI